MKEGRVYFIRCGDQVKIGFSTAVSRRLKALQTGAAVPLELLGTIPGSMAHEAALHKAFGHLSLTGEWFRLTPELMLTVTNLVDNPSSFAFDLSSRAKRPSRSVERHPLAAETAERIHRYFKALFPTRTAQCVAEATGISLNTIEKSIERSGCFSPLHMHLFLEVFGPGFLAACYSPEMRPKWLDDADKAERRARITTQLAELQGQVEVAL